MSSFSGRDVLIIDAVRTPIARGHREKGHFRDLHPNVLLGAVYRETIRRAGVEAALVDDVVAGCVQQLAEQSFNVARNAWLQAGLPVETPATTVDRQCGSAQQGVNFAASLIASNIADVAIGAGVESMSRVPFSIGPETQATYGTPYPPEFLQRHDVVGQGLGAEMIADEWDVSRRELEELAERSHALAHRATEEGRFDREILAVEGADGPVTRDQGIRPDTNADALAGLRPAFKPDGKVTAATSSQISDGAAAVLLADAGRAAELGLRGRARIVDHTTVGCDPVKMLEGPIPATRKILRRNGMTIDDIDLFEVNEAFAPVIAAWQRELSPDMDRVNVNGGAMALGHPLGSSGARLITTLLHELERTDKQVGLVTMCCGGGIGTATLIERV